MTRPLPHTMNGDEIERCRKERRFRVVPFSPDFLLSLYQGSYEVVEHDLPEKWHVLHGYWDATSDSVCIVLCSTSFDRVPDGEVLPHVDLAKCRKHECGLSENASDVIQRGALVLREQGKYDNAEELVGLLL